MLLKFVSLKNEVILEDKNDIPPNEFLMFRNDVHTWSQKSNQLNTQFT